MIKPWTFYKLSKASWHLTIIWLNIKNPILLISYIYPPHVGDNIIDIIMCRYHTKLYYINIDCGLIRQQNAEASHLTIHKHAFSQFSQFSPFRPFRPFRASIMQHQSLCMHPFPRQCNNPMWLKEDFRSNVNFSNLASFS